MTAPLQPSKSLGSAAQRLQDFWDKRYAGEGFAYGSAPNDFLQASCHFISPAGEVLCVADGEGRNGVWLAQQGMKVTSVDIAPQGMAKAHALALQRGVALNTEVADLTHYPLGHARWDAIVSIFLHFPAQLRQAFHARCLDALKPGGVLIYEVYGDLQLGLGTGGPREAELLPSAAEVAADFASVSVLHSYAGLRDIHEGNLHSGAGYVVQLVLQK
jgi:SAM-dependent methyltransferase